MQARPWFCASPEKVAGGGGWHFFPLLFFPSHFPYGVGVSSYITNVSDKQASKQETKGWINPPPPPPRPTCTRLCRYQFVSQWFKILMSGSLKVTNYATAKTKRVSSSPCSNLWWQANIQRKYIKSIQRSSYLFGYPKRQPPPPPLFFLQAWYTCTCTFWRYYVKCIIWAQIFQIVKLLNKFCSITISLRKWVRETQTLILPT